MIFLNLFEQLRHTASGESYITSFTMTSRVLTNFYSKYTNLKTLYFSGFFSCDFLKLFTQLCRAASGEGYITSFNMTSRANA